LTAAAAAAAAAVPGDTVTFLAPCAAAVPLVAHTFYCSCATTLVVHSAYIISPSSSGSAVPKPGTKICTKSVNGDAAAAGSATSAAASAFAAAAAAVPLRLPPLAPAADLEAFAFAPPLLLLASPPPRSASASSAAPSVCAVVAAVQLPCVAARRAAEVCAIAQPLCCTRGEAQL
jgi:hypothetical protein